MNYMIFDVNVSTWNTRRPDESRYVTVLYRVYLCILVVCTLSQPLKIFPDSEWGDVRTSNHSGYNNTMIQIMPTYADQALFR